MRSGLGQPRPDELSRMQRAGIATVIAIGYALSVTTLGYILATMLMTAAMAWYLGLRNPFAFIPGVIVIPILIRFVFERLLLISLPRSSIESIGLVEDAVLRFLVHIFIPYARHARNFGPKRRSAAAVGRLFLHFHWPDRRHVRRRHARPHHHPGDGCAAADFVQA
jgi:hypothetical protein